MLKLLSIILLITVNLQQNVAKVIEEDNVISLLYNTRPIKSPTLPEISSKWEKHIMDFVNLIDIDKVLAVAMGYLSDPEVLNFVGFIFSDDFKKIVWDFESMAEFKEAFKFLADKGYEVGSLIDFINDALNLPPFEKAKVRIAMYRKGVTGFIEDMLAALPLEEFKKMFESKLETSPEVAELFETINSPEFMDILKRMAKNPEFERFKIIFESYGFDFKYLCQLAKEIFGEYYQGIFCG